MKEWRLRRIQVLGLTRAEDASAETDDAAAPVGDREHQSAAETVVGAARSFSG